VAKNDVRVEERVYCAAKMSSTVNIRVDMVCAIKYRTLDGAKTDPKGNSQLRSSPTW
jgi:hypothetical protein